MMCLARRGRPRWAAALGLLPAILSFPARAERPVIAVSAEIDPADTVFLELLRTQLRQVEGDGVDPSEFVARQAAARLNEGITIFHFQAHRAGQPHTARLTLQIGSTGALWPISPLRIRLRMEAGAWDAQGRRLSTTWDERGHHFFYVLREGRPGPSDPLTSARWLNFLQELVPTWDQEVGSLFRGVPIPARKTRRRSSSISTQETYSALKLRYNALLPPALFDVRKAPTDLPDYSFLACNRRLVGGPIIGEQDLGKRQCPRAGGRQVRGTDEWQEIYLHRFWGSWGAPLR